MPRAGLTTQRLVEVAADLADDLGLDRVTVSELARRVDVKPASLYSHLDGSDDLHRRLALLALDDMATSTAHAVAGRSGFEALQALADSYRDYARKHPGRYAASHTPLDDATARASAGPEHTSLVGAILRGYDVPEADHPHAVRMLGSTIHGFIQLEAAGSFDHSAPPPQTSWRHVIAGLDAALRHWPAH